MSERIGADAASIQPLRPDRRPSDCEPPRVRLRRVLHDRASTVEDAAWYLDRATRDLAQGDEVRLALEELIDHVGRLLGFDTRRHDALDCSVWTSSAGPVLAVIVEAPAAAAARISSFARVRQALLASSSAAHAASVSGLCVLCAADSESVEHAIIVRRAADHVRVITIRGLVALGRLFEHGVVHHPDVAALLRPARPAADDLIALLARLRRRD